jgi:TonB family protein
MKTLYKITFVLLFLAGAGLAQTDVRDKGIEAYRRGYYKQAVSILENASRNNETKNDAEVWSYLGLAYANSGESKKGLAALKNAVKLNPQSANIRTNLGYVYLLMGKINNAQQEISKALELDPKNTGAYFIRGTSRLRENDFDGALADAEKLIEIDPNYAPAYTLKSNVFTTVFGKKVTKGSAPVDEIGWLQKSIDALEYCLGKCVDNENLELQKDKLAGVKAFYEFFTRNKTQTISDVSGTNEQGVSGKINILAKPAASYTDSARQNNITGTINACVLFGANGKIPYVVLLNSLGYGLDEQVIKAVQRIRFEPATKDGKPIPVVKIVQYSFSIY